MSSGNFKAKQTILLVVSILLLTALIVVGFFNFNPAWLKIMISSVLAVLLCACILIKTFVKSKNTTPKEK